MLLLLLARPASADDYPGPTAKDVCVPFGVSFLPSDAGVEVRRGVPRPFLAWQFQVPGVFFTHDSKVDSRGMPFVNRHRLVLEGDWLVPRAGADAHEHSIGDYGDAGLRWYSSGGLGGGYEDSSERNLVGDGKPDPTVRCSAVVTLANVPLKP